MITLEAVYDPKQYEKKWWKFWSDGGFFESKVNPSKKPFTILMPPPNITNQLHMGHGTTYSLQDILVRWKRMSGYEALWLPGTDHAGIATQMVVEKALLAEDKKTRQEIGRPAFEKKLWAWNEKYGGRIKEQFRSIGFSCDWKRDAFTMSPALSRAVRKIFVDLFNDGLIYRGERLVNWDPQLKTAISDDEVENVETNGTLWYFSYPIEDGSPGESLTIATTRPETMLGDTAVAVNPDDERYKALIGKFVRLPLADRVIPIIADSYVQQEFGTGCVKVTPAHDPNDFDMGKRHKLPFLNIMNDDGTMAQNVPARFRGLDRFVARKEVLKAMKELGFFVKEEGHKLTVPHSDRSKAVIEPRLSLQWFVDMKSLAAPAVEVAKSGQLNFYPESWKKVYLHWLENIQDWCISRQLWWGHRMPIWYCQDCTKVSTGMEDPTKCTHCGSTKLKQEDDVLDTWFSSWLWPISPFGWPDETPDINYFYPTDVLVTASEILFLWVARMVMVGLRTRGKLPFKDVYLAATICDKQGRKFSKTLGNGIDPLDVIEKHGSDAMRFTCVNLAPIGGRVRMDINDFDHGGRFINKLWNASRFLLMQLSEEEKIQPIDLSLLDLPLKWLLTELSITAEKINRDLENYRMSEALQTLYHFIWGSFCDWGLECSKEAFNGTDKKVKDNTLSVLVYVLDGILRLASPIMPFVTEEIWHKLPNHPQWDRPKSLVLAQYPKRNSALCFESEALKWEKIQALITGIRSLRSQAGIPPKDQLEVFVKADAADGALFKSALSLIVRLANVKKLECSVELKKPSQSLVNVGKGFEVYVPVGDYLDIEKEKKRLSSEVERIGKIVAGINAKLQNRDFIARAPEEIVEQTKMQKDNLESQLGSLKQNLQALTD